MLLAGIALGALAGSPTGLLIYVSDDRQLRDLTFGSLGGATWGKVAIAAAFVLPVLAVAPFMARAPPLFVTIYPRHAEGGRAARRLGNFGTKFAAVSAYH